MVARFLEVMTMTTNTTTSALAKLDADQAIRAQELVLMMLETRGVNRKALHGALQAGSSKAGSGFHPDGWGGDDSAENVAGRLLRRLQLDLHLPMASALAVAEELLA
jgi:hypothetical protein